jgi:hypothetical protein
MAQGSTSLVRQARNDKGRDHSRPLRFSAWRRYQVRRDMPRLVARSSASASLAGAARPSISEMGPWRLCYAKALRVLR